MPCYVDDVRIPYRNMLMAHLWSDTEAELLAMADKIGVNRKWIQGHKRLSIGKAKQAQWLHFDICASKKRDALRHGAKLTDKYGPAEHCAKLDMKSSDPAICSRGQLTLNRIKVCRANTSTAGNAATVRDRSAPSLFEEQ